MELIKIYDNVLESSFCNNIIEKFNTSKHQYKGTTGAGYNKDIKLTTDLAISRLTEDPEWLNIDNIINEKLNKYLIKYTNDIKSLNKQYAFSNMVFQDTGFLMQKYNKNEGFFSYHTDTDSFYENNCTYQRHIVYLFYINDVNEGGETIIWNDVKIKPKCGRLLLFPSTWCYPHSGSMPISDNKYIITGWLYN